ncbi:hypothetical protein EYZ11_013554 [Aspergillus tanneri]|uniref:Methyltransferase domain-containing protein n=1 Tax=Aspergillus tanneri TaxID=1220188 RepID=A0A4S3IXD0_9EURO|nr:uncharacterized protein ATNIH1004_006483 [Aspergillus tanneri]KAA8647782.1 hypothetical protein ATNIH1004_006483 [Aspergillus tanneri]THC87000.1 hypothetical protein EYZ11_013554 [Aspergillus tanneri]
MATPANVRTHTKIAGAPDYDDPSYWDAKFATGQGVGEWLNPGEMLIDAALSDLQGRASFAAGVMPRVLHLGPGISKLGIKLRDAFVKQNWMGSGIVNVDFSAEAVRLGREHESTEDPSHAMQWLQVDLRSWEDMTSLFSFAPFDLILDKGTSDALATAESISFSANFSLTGICPTVLEVIDNHGGLTLSPVELLGLYLVPLTKQGAVWIALSYSTMRFDNLPFLASHWELVSRTPVKAPQGEISSFAYAPEVFHWIYILRRK